MKKILASAACLVSMTLAQAATPATEPKVAKSETSALHGLEIGTRILYVSLKDDEKGTGTDTRDDNYLGSIDMLDVDQDYVPLRLYMQYFFSTYVGCGISYDKVEADAADESGSDGTLSISGPIFYLVGRYNNDSYFTPFAEVGVATYNASFDESAAWADDGDYKRYMDVEDATAFVLAIGCDYYITESLSANLYARMVTGTDMNADHYNSEDPSDPRQSGEFNLDYIGAGVGIKYAFE